MIAKTYILFALVAGGLFTILPFAYQLSPMSPGGNYEISDSTFWFFILILLYPISMTFGFLSYFGVLKNHEKNRRSELDASHSEPECNVMKAFTLHQKQMSRVAVGLQSYDASPPPLPPESVAASTSSQAMDAIKALHAMKNEGLITEEEFNIKKQDILNRL